MIVKHLVDLGTTIIVMKTFTNQGRPKCFEVPTVAMIIDI